MQGGVSAVIFGQIYLKYISYVQHLILVWSCLYVVYLNNLNELITFMVDLMMRIKTEKLSAV